MKTYLFLSTRDPSLTPYRTLLHDNGAITCSCPARVECWHIKRVREFPIGRTERTPIDREDARLVMRLLLEGNDSGAREALGTLFPSMCLEEQDELLQEFFGHQPDACVIDGCELCGEFYNAEEV